MAARTVPETPSNRHEGVYTAIKSAREDDLTLNVSGWPSRSSEQIMQYRISLFNHNLELIRPCLKIR
jgi:hypothetical protein